MLTRTVRYQIDPQKKTEFERYNCNWSEAIPLCGEELVGYSAPHEGLSISAYGIYNVGSLADCESYRVCLARDPLGQENCALAQEEKFLLREDRAWLKQVGGAGVRTS